MMLLFLVDSKKMMALGGAVRQRADSAGTWRGSQWPWSWQDVPSQRRSKDLPSRLAATRTSFNGDQRNDRRGQTVHRHVRSAM
jgi:hypothetical protein